MYLELILVHTDSKQKSALHYHYYYYYYLLDLFKSVTLHYSKTKQSSLSSKE